MKKIIPFILGLSLVILGHEGQCRLVQESDSIRGAELYTEGMTSYGQGEYVKSIGIFDQALLSFSEKNLQAYATTLVRMGIVYATIPDFDKALTYFEKAEPLALKVKNQLGIYHPIIHQQMQLAYTLYELRRFDEALPIFNETERLIKEDSLNYYLLSYISGSKGRMCVKAGKFELGKQYIDEGLVFAKKSDNQNALAQALNVASSYYIEIGNIRKAKLLNEEIMDLKENSKEKNDISLGVTYSLQGRLELQSQEYERALEYLLNGKMIHDEFPDQRKNNRAYNFYYLGVAYSELGDFVQAEMMLEQAMNIYNEIKVGDEFMAIIWAEYGKALTQTKKYDQAKILFEKVFQILNKTEIGVLEETTALLSRANYLQATGNRDEARVAYEDLIQRLEVKFDNINSPLSNVYYEYCKLELASNNVQKALDLVHKALSSNQSLVDGVGYNSLNVISSANHIEYLLQKSRVLRQIAENGNATIQECLNPLDSAIRFIQSARVTRVGSAFSMNALEKIKNEAMYICFKLYQQSGDNKYIDRAFAYSEMAKSQLLYEWVQQAEDHGVSGINDSLLNVQQNLLEQIQFYKYQAENSKREQGDQNIEFLRLNDSLSLMSKTYFEVVKNYKESNPKYYSTLYSSMLNVEPVHQISKDQNSDLIAFSQSDSAIYAFVLGSKPGFFRLTNKNMADEIFDFRQSIIEYNQMEYHRLGHLLYKTFFEPLENNLSFDRLCIINDGSLWYLPFEILVSQDNANDEQKFLCETYQISYAYSSRFLKNSARNSNEVTELLAIAPEFNLDASIAMNDVVRGQMVGLPGARLEISQLSELFESKLMYGIEATETNFRAEAKNGKIIHLATHAIVDDLYSDFSKLVFNLVGDTLNDGYLHAYEIYNLELNAQLVTLSACNTGFGQIKKGEGVMSLSRAFAYAGVPATVVSLWPASDKSTPELMKYFYQNLKEGQAKDVALNNARKQYLATATGKAQHPFYWGGFVLIGDDRPIETGSSNVAIILTLLFLLTVVPIVLVIKKKYLSIEG